MLLSIVTALAITAVGTVAQRPELFSPLIAQKVLATAQRLPRNLSAYPQYTDRSRGIWTQTPADGWTSGFFPATLYAMNQRTELCGTDYGTDWLSLGRWSVGGLIPLQRGNSVGHDQGFLSFAFVDELNINPSNQTAINGVLDFARILASRFVPVVGCTRSWDSSSDRVTVIIDNMMNLEVLFVANEITGDQSLIDIAISHADVTMANHIREDGSTWHVLEYSPVDGHVIDRHTAQGYSDDSTWTRGQAWGFYGFANIYRRTQKRDYLLTARRMANLFLSRLPANGIVPWDFDAPPDAGTGVVPSDSSAATLAATALLLLAEVEEDDELRHDWIEGALKLLDAVTDFAFKEEREGWQSVLSNGTINHPAGSYSTGIIYADYYYIMAGNALVRMGLASCK